MPIDLAQISYSPLEARQHIPSIEEICGAKFPRRPSGRVNGRRLAAGPHDPDHPDTGFETVARLVVHIAGAISGNHLDDKDRDNRSETY